MERGPNDTVLELLQELKPGQLLVISERPVPAVTAYCDDHPETHLTQLPSDTDVEAIPERRFDLALVADALEKLQPNNAEQLLGRLRNLHSGQLLLAVEAESCLTQNQLFGLGLTRLAHFAHSDGDRALDLYGYDIASYNRVREWNNPRYWANPENGGKYWW